MLNIQPGQKNRLFFEKVEYFLPPEGPDVRNFFSGKFSAPVARKQQMLLISTTNVVFGFKSILKDFRMDLSRKIGVLRGAPQFA